MSGASASAEAGLLPIGELSRSTGLAASAIRYYERCGLVTPIERAGGKRRFDADAVSRLRIIMEVQRAGFSLDEIRLLLGPRGADPELRRALVQKKLAEVRRDIRRLRSIERALEAALECGCDSLEHCRLPSLSQAATSQVEASAPRRRPESPATGRRGRNG